MNLKKAGSLEYYTFDSFEKIDFIGHGFTTRRGGVSEGFLSSLNLGFSRGDKRENVDTNFDIICDALGVKKEQCVTLRQVHSTRIIMADESIKGMGFRNDTERIEADAFVTNKKGIVLVTFHADCVPLFFVDTEKKAIGMAHAGWRGTADGMAAEMIIKMINEFGSNPKNIKVGIGPSIGLCCFQVDKPVTDIFNEKYSFASKYIINDEEAECKYKIDLWGINKEVLMSKGVKEENIEIGGICTKCNPEIFYSHRVMGEKRGTMGAFLFLK
ncbi:MAG: peptidoglycan editing factor PgeF [Candidatus Metalachnospira sp.]|nr:peptidoglycan editing factor PgeF [Candidatus Metalachnospira sp.]